MNRRTTEHFHNCPSGKPLLLDYYPRLASASQAELSLAQIKPGVKVPFADMLEELIHIKLADIAANALPSGAILSGQRLGVNRRRPPCVDCEWTSSASCFLPTPLSFPGGHVHEEIFTFRRLPGAQRRYEWELLVLPVIELWGAYVHELVARV